MAKQPRQQRILSYGEFRPTGVDDSAARRMQALAGLGETVAGVAEQLEGLRLQSWLLSKHRRPLKKQ